MAEGAKARENRADAVRPATVRAPGRSATGIVSTWVRPRDGWRGWRRACTLTSILSSPTGPSELLTMLATAMHAVTAGGGKGRSAWVRLRANERQGSCPPLSEELSPLAGCRVAPQPAIVVPRASLRSVKARILVSRLLGLALGAGSSVLAGHPVLLRPLAAHAAPGAHAARPQA